MKRNSPVRTWLGSTAGSTVILFTVTLPLGCRKNDLPPPVTGWTSRFDHVYNKSNEDRAVAARDTFKPQQTVIDPILTQNLKARHDAETTVLEAEAQVVDTAFASATTDVTWNQLRQQLLADLGLADEEIKPEVDAGKTRDDILRDRIEERQRKLTAVAKVLQLIADVHGGLAELAADDLAKANEALSKAQKATTQPAVPPPPEPATEKEKRDKTRQERVDWFQKALDALVKAGDDTRDSAKVKAEATAKQQELLTAVARSRDPAAAYALVAVVGTGLDRRSLTLLDTYIENLKAHLEKITPPPSATSLTGLSNVTDREAYRRSFSDVQRALGITQPASLAATTTPGAPPLLATSGMRLLNNLKISTRPGVQASLGASTNNQLLRAVGELEAARQRNEQTVKRSRASARAAGSFGIVSASHAASREAKQSVRMQMFTTRTDLSTPETKGSTGSGDKEKIKNASSLATAWEFLKGVEAASPANVTALQNRIERTATDRTVEAAQKLPTEKIRQEDLKLIGDFVNSIGKLAAEAKARALEFWRDLVQIQSDLNEENIRHNGALAAIANSELKRWLLLAALNDDYGRAFATANAATVDLSRDRPENDLYPIFADVQQLDAAASEYGNKLGTLNPAPFRDPYKVPTGPANVLRHPPVSLESHVMSSIRQLAETAKAWHDAKPSVQDPEGRNLAASHERLVHAVRTVQGHLLMVSLNMRLGGESRIGLTDELAMHDFRLESFNGQIREAGFRLSLNDLAAFHSTGITEADIRAIESAGLYYIGYRAGK